MMALVVPETCWAYKKYNKIISDIYLAFYSSVIAFLIQSRSVLSLLTLLFPY